MTQLLTRPTAVEVARQHFNQSSAQYQRARREAHRAAHPEFDPALLKPVGMAPTPPMSAQERRLLEQELRCLERERAQTARAIAHLHHQLGH